MHSRIPTSTPLSLFALLLLLQCATVARGSAAMCRNGSVRHDATVYLAADNDATLYHNGQPLFTATNWQQVTSRSFVVAHGDTIAIKARSYARGFGVIAQIALDGRVVAVTGHDSHGWRASLKYTINKDKPDIWTTRSFSTCAWAVPVRVTDPRLNVIGLRRAPYFPTRHYARYVWATMPRRAAGVKTRVLYLRYRIGGDSCMLQMLFGTGRNAFLFVNGKIVASVYNSFILTSGSVRVRNGDVVSLRVFGSRDWHGVMVSLGQYSTGVHTNWRAIKVIGAGAAIAGNSFAWMYPGFDACTWPRVVPALANSDKLPLFSTPLAITKERGRYVKALGLGVGESFNMRTVIGGGC